jgi:hypothetical protein
LRVLDVAGWVVRSEGLPAGTDLHARLQIAHENYVRQGWVVGELHPGQWAVEGSKDGEFQQVKNKDGKPYSIERR